MTLALGLIFLPRLKITVIPSEARNLLSSALANIDQSLSPFMQRECAIPTTSNKIDPALITFSPPSFLSPLCSPCPLW